MRGYQDQWERTETGVKKDIGYIVSNAKTALWSVSPTTPFAIANHEGGLCMDQGIGTDISNSDMRVRGRITRA